MDEAVLAPVNPVIDLIPSRFHRLRQVLHDENFGGRTLLYYLLGKLKNGSISVHDLGLGTSTAANEIAFLQKLEVITSLAVVVSARGGNYAMDEQVEDFLLFTNAADICRYQNMEKFRRAVLPVILWAIAEDDKLRRAGDVPAKFRMPIDILVAIGAEVAAWHMAMTQDSGELADDIDEEILRGTMASTVRETYQMIASKLQSMSLHWAVNEIRARFGISSVAVQFEA